MVTDSASVQRSQWTAYKKPPSLLRTVPSLISYDLPFLQNGGSTMPQGTRMAISPQRVIRYTSCLVLAFSGSADRMALYPVTSNPSWRQAAILYNFEWSYLRNGSFDPLIQHSADTYLRAVVFAVAQLSCSICHHWRHNLA